MTIVEHLEELRYRVLICLLALLAGGVAAWQAVPHVLGALAKVAGRLIVTSPAEAFLGYLKILLVLDLTLAAPVLVAQAWLYVVPGLYPHEIRLITRVAPAAGLLFGAGIAFGYLVVYPVALRFLLGQAGPGVVPALALSRYLSFLVSVTLPFGVIFEMPLASYLLARFGMLTGTALRRGRRWAILAAFTAGALLTPTVDAVTQSLMAGPIVLLYELSIYTATWAGRQRRQWDESDSGTLESRSHA